MTVLRVPEQFDSIGKAVDAAQPRDTILVRNGNYPEAVTLSKEGLRIIADGDRVILDGSGRLDTGFSLNEVSFVAIEGFAIRNFIKTAIQAQGGGGHRFVHNRIGGQCTPECPANGVETSLGIDLQGSSQNLIWRNRLQGVCAGVSIEGNGLANRVLGNVILEPK